MHVILSTGQHRCTAKLNCIIDPRLPSEFKERKFVKFATPHQVYHAVRGRTLVRTFTTKTRRPEIDKKKSIRGGADKSLARPGRKQATATKLGIYSTYSPRNSIDFLAHCSNYCHSL